MYVYIVLYTTYISLYTQQIADVQLELYIGVTELINYKTLCAENLLRFDKHY